jgi:primosomal protein N' (replication factor Y) (superfamily II helicase)
MNYYKVLVTSNKFHGTEPLTYCSENVYAKGNIVLVPLRNSKSTAIIISTTPKPRFETKAIASLLISLPIPKSSIDLLTWIKSYYPASISSITSLFVPSNLLIKNSNEVNTKGRSVTKQPTFATLPNLSLEQVNVLDKIHSSSSTTFLLHGETGSGKTRVYIELILKEIANGKSSIVLTPEISLTPQLERIFKESLPVEVCIIHSNLTLTERRNIWLKSLNTKQPIVIVGPRSALFVPLNNLGLIVVDEFHDNAYKQDQSPYYSAVRVASALSNIKHAKLVLGSATPTIAEYYFATKKQAPILRMSSLAMGGKKNINTEVINVRDRSNFTKSNFISNKLIDAISHTIQNKQQSLLFLNRRGTARLILCQNCDWQALCPKCDLPLTYHGDTHVMLCHTCGFRQNTITSCPECKSHDIVFRNIGTKAIEEQLQKIFPEARIMRFDTDNSKQEKFNQHYNQIINGGVDILVGTQMLVKGLDLPDLSLVGVVAADSSLYFPDFSSEEQTYQLLKQVIGRVSRGHQSGKVIIQTLDPTGYAQVAALNNTWEDFYNQQLDERKKYLYPPFCFLLKLTCSRKSQKTAQSAAENLKKLIESLPLKAQIIGPSPRFVEKSNGMYNWQLTVKSKRRPDLINIIGKLPANWSYDIDPTNLL